MSRIECIDETLGLWSAEMHTKQGFSVRTTILRLSDGSLALFGPARGLEDAIAELGTPSLLIAPNHYHHLGLARYHERWPEAQILCSETAKARLLKKSRISSYGSLDSLRDKLPANAELLEPPALKSGEIFLRAQTAEGVAWAVSDAFFNLPSHLSGVLGFICRATRTSRGIRVGRTFTTLGVQDKKVYGSWLRNQLDTDKPTVLMPGHGDVHRGQDLYALLDAETRGRLRA